LTSKKKKLLAAGDQSKYLLDPKHIEVISKNPDQTFDLMLPEETIKV